MKRHIVLLSGKGLDVLRLEKGLKKLIGENVLVDDKKEYVIVSLPDSESYSVFVASFSALRMDCSESMKALLLPNDNPTFYSSFLDKVEEGTVENMYGLVRTRPEFIHDLLWIVEPFDQDMLYTIKAYIENDCSPLLSSYALFVHRNTITYRIKTFSTKTGILLDCFSNNMLVYELVLSHLNSLSEFTDENG